MGAGYRDLWTTAIRVNVLDLDTYGGGLTPARLGGGMTTRTLHVNGGDGRRYVLRSVDKVPADLLEDFLGSPLESVLRDQVSSFHPSGALVVASLLDAVEVLHPTPELVVVPDDPRLGEFREEFAGLLALLEERPDNGPDGAPGFAGSRRIVQTGRLFEILEEEPGNRVDAAELLRARLIDLLVGDRDRSTNNHLWARFDEPGGGYRWRPVPRDRDQAFVQFDGVLKRLARRYDPRLVPFGGDYASVSALTRNAWDIDRNFLVSISRADWVDIVADVKQRLSDDVLEQAVRKLPLEHYRLSGARLEAELKQRRDRLDRAAQELYDIVFRYADVQGTDESEAATVERSIDGSLRVTLQPFGSAAATFDRRFTADETREVRLYLRGGSDKLTVTGSGPRNITLRAIGGGGRDEFKDLAAMSGAGNLFYDSGNGTIVSKGPGTRFYREDAPRPFSWHEESRTLDWGSSWAPETGVAYDADRGVVLTAAATLRRFGFLKRPDASQTRVSAGWAFGLSEPILDARHRIREAFAGGDLGLHIRWSGSEIIDFYGFGNETPVLGPRPFHRVTHKRLLVSAQWTVGSGERWQAGFGPVFQHLSTNATTTSTYLGQTRPYGSGRFQQAGIQATALFDARDRPRLPARGYRVEGQAALFPELLSVDRGAFGHIEGRTSAYLSPPGSNPVLAVRAQGKHVWGAYPFAEAAFLGGESSQRGLRDHRYAGRTSLLGGAEVRLKVGQWAFPVPGDYGLLALAERGRVFHDGESSDKWRSTFGGGLWFSPLLQPMALHLTVTRSGSRTAYYAGMGFAF